MRLVHVASLRHISSVLLAVLLLGLLFVLPFSPAVRAAGSIQYVFSYTDDLGAVTDCRDIATGCTLRDALNAAADGDTIQFAHGTPYPITYTLTHGTLTVGHSVTIEGPGAGNLLISGGGAVGVLTVNSGVTATISGLTIENGSRTNGGGIVNSGTLTVTNSTLSGNSASGGSYPQGGGIYNIGTLTLTNSTLSGNLGGFGGGGIINTGTVMMSGSTLSGNSASVGGGIDTSGTLTVTNSTLSGNSGGNGGGIYNNSGTATLANVTLAGNSATSGGGVYTELHVGGIVNVHATLLANPSGGNCGGVSVGSQDYNLASDASCTGIIAAHDRTGVVPGLDPGGLRANGGPTATVAILPNSPAIEAGGPCTGGVTQDQRGQPRVGACDIGAYEYQPVTPIVQNATAPASGGPVTFHGTGFQTGSQLTMGSTSIIASASGVSDDGTSMALSVPAHSAGAVGFTIANPGGGPAAAGTLTYVPVVASLSPASGSTTGGASVTITGAGFVLGSTGVAFGNAAATVTSVTPTTVTVAAPAHAAGTADVTVTVNGVSGTKAGAYTYGTVNVLPSAQSPGQTNGSPPPLPGTRPTTAPVGGTEPHPLPTGR